MLNLKFFVEFEKTCNDYISAIGNLSEDEKKNYLIKVLLASYSVIGIFMD